MIRSRSDMPRFKRYGDPADPLSDLRNFALTPAVSARMRALSECRMLRELIEERAQHWVHEGFPTRADAEASCRWQHSRSAAPFVRALVERRARRRCEQCRGRGEVLHHRHYRSFNREIPCDVELLCRPCHSRIHAGRTGAAPDFSKPFPKKWWPK